MEYCNPTALVDLLYPKQDSDSDEDDVPSNTMASMTPGNIKLIKQEEKTVAPAQPKKATKDIWEEENVPEGSEYDSIYDNRIQPEYDIIYKQSVTSEDMFLQMGQKNPSSSSCESMVVNIVLPDARNSEIDLDVKPKFLDCRTPKYKLGLHLPHPVDDKSGKAEWDKSKSTLKVTLKLQREYDFMNF